MTFCPQCGATLPAQARFCGTCGFSLSDLPSSPAAPPAPPVEAAPPALSPAAPPVPAEPPLPAMAPAPVARPASVASAPPRAPAGAQTMVLPAIRRINTAAEAGVEAPPSAAAGGPTAGAPSAAGGPTAGASSAAGGPTAGALPSTAGGPLAEAPAFLAQQLAPVAEPPARPKGGASETVLGMPSPFAPPGSDAAPPPQRAPRAGAVTQLGVFDPQRVLEPSTAAPAGSVDAGAARGPAAGSVDAGAARGPAAGAAEAPAPRDAGKVTVLGLGLAQVGGLGPGQAQQGGPGQAQQGGPGPGSPVQNKLTSLGLGPAAAFAPKIEEMPGAPNAARGSPVDIGRRTVQGIAVPGIAPVTGEGRKPRPGIPQGQIESLEAAVREKKPARVEPRPRGVSSWAWALGAAGVIAVGGIVAALVVPGSAPLQAEVKLDEAGRDMLRVTCAKCPEGTKLSAAGGATVETKGGVADVPLGVPLKVGENEVEIAVDRPGAGRDERVPLKVPLAFRIWPELRTLQDPTPVITVMVEAVAGSAVTLQGRPVALDAQGRGREVFDVRDDVRGQRGEPALLTKQIPYTVAPKGARLETGAVEVKVGVVPLALETPGPKVVTERPTFLLAGRTAKGAGVSVGDRALPVQPDGSFVQWMSISSEGTSEVEVRALAPPLAPRAAAVTVTRVHSLADEAAKREQRGGPGYAEVSGEPEAAAGRAVAWRGEVVEAANQGQRTIAVVSVRTGCKAPPCLARAELSGPDAVARGDKVALFGAVGGFAPLRDGRVPELTPEFFVKVTKLLAGCSLEAAAEAGRVIVIDAAVGAGGVRAAAAVELGVEVVAADEDLAAVVDPLVEVADEVVDAVGADARGGGAGGQQGAFLLVDAGVVEGLAPDHGGVAEGAEEGHDGVGAAPLVAGLGGVFITVGVGGFLGAPTGERVFSAGTKSLTGGLAGGAGLGGRDVPLGDGAGGRDGAEGRGELVDGFVGRMRAPRFAVGVGDFDVGLPAVDAVGVFVADFGHFAGAAAEGALGRDVLGGWRGEGGLGGRGLGQIGAFGRVARSVEDGPNQPPERDARVGHVGRVYANAIVAGRPFRPEISQRRARRTNRTVVGIFHRAAGATEPKSALRRPFRSGGIYANAGAAVSTLRKSAVLGGAYRLERLVVRGSVGDVWDAREVPTGRAVVVKTLGISPRIRPDLAQRFAREERIARTLNSPYVCRLVGAGVGPDGLPFLAYERLEGETLGARLERASRLELAEFAPLLGDLFDGLGHVHGVGIVHRDVKPDNVFLERGEGGARERVRLIDFGVSKLDENEGDGVTTDSTVLGSMAYMPPEQAVGSSPVGPWTDLYAVGAVAFYALSGRRPFEAPTAEGVLALKRYRNPPTLTAVTNGAWPASLEAFLARLLAREPSDRYATAAEARAAWAGVCAEQGVALDPPGEAAGPGAPKTPG
jgi:protein kinase-like protein